MNWSLILPTRERTEKLANMLESVKETSADPANVEMLVAFDLDDNETAAWIGESDPMAHCPEPGVLVARGAKFFACQRSENFSKEYYNMLCRHATGRYVFALNDDTRFVTPGWDGMAAEALDAARAKWKDGCVFGRCRDGYGALFACFPILSREAIDLQGHFFHEGFKAWGADIHLHRVWAACHRVVDLPFRVEHVSHHTGLDEAPDEVHLRMKALSERGYAHATTAPEAARIARLLRGQS